MKFCLVDTASSKNDQDTDHMRACIAPKSSHLACLMTPQHASLRLEQCSGMGRCTTHRPSAYRFSQHPG